ncbi:MAG TPA: ATP-binding protein, partial [Bacteroidota bacterium]|nr:ATP-binding protein [Bacteroidota bacterium]
TIVITDTHGTIDYVNPRFTALTGYTPEEAIGKNPRLLNAGRLPKEVYEGLWKTIAAGKEWSGELLNRKKNGELFWENATIAPVRDENGTVTHFVAIKEDITKRKQAEEELARRAEDLFQAKSRAEQQAIRLGVQAFELRKAREEALKASKLKSEFVANMSHEIRTPMNGVLGMAGLLLDTSLSDEQREYAEIIRTSGEALLGIVNDILDFSKIEAGKLELESIEFNLRSTIEEAIDLVAVAARKKSLALRFDMADGIPSWLRGDPGRIRQVMSNLLSNGVKFTERGEVAVRVRAGAAGGGLTSLTIGIRDTGIGISEEELTRLFKPFSQADGSTTRRHGGTGLGLVIAKQLVEMMGGEIGCRSAKGKGSEFWFTLRLPDGSPRAAAGGVEGVVAERRRPERLRRVLVAEDNQINQRVALRMLEKMGCRADVVANGKEAVEAVGRLPYDLVLMDCQMPVMDGFEATACIRKLNGRGGTTLVVAMTANALQGDRERCIQAGMDDYLPKPVTQEALEQLLAKWDLVLAKAGANPPAPQGEEGLDPEKVAELRELGADDGPAWLETLVRSFLRDSAGRVEKLRDAVAGGDVRSFEEVAHALKGSSATLGVTPMHAIAERLQALGRAGTIAATAPLITELERELHLAEHRLERALLGKEEE